MARIIIRDNVDIQLPGSVNVFDSKDAVSLNDSILEDNAFFRDKALQVVIDATHCGYFNQNSYFYVHDGMASGVSSFIEPYLKPILTEHEGQVVPLGRVKEAAFIPIPEGTFDKKHKDAIYRGVPTGKIRLTTLITDVEGMQRIMRSQFMTVSTGGAPTAIPYCSHCKEPVTVSFGRPVLSCDHVTGSIEDDSYVGMIVPQVHYDECSFVNHPADYTSQHAAGVVSMDLVEYDYSQETFKTYHSMVKRERELIMIDSKNEEDKMKDDKDKTKEVNADENTETVVSGQEPAPVQDPATDADSPDNTEGEQSVETDVPAVENTDSETPEITLSDAEVKAAEITAKYEELQKEVTTLKKANDDLKQKLESQTEKTKAADSEILELNKKIKDLLIDSVIDVSIYTKQKAVDSIRNSENEEEYKKAYDAYKIKLSERSMSSLEDKMVDLKMESKADSAAVSETVDSGVPTDEGTDDPFQSVIDNREKGQVNDKSSLEEKLFPEDEDKDK